MGEFIVAPIAIVVILLVVYATIAFHRTSRAGKERATLPEEPQARRVEELRRMKREHAEADPPYSEV